MITEAAARLHSFAVRQEGSPLGLVEAPLLRLRRHHRAEGTTVHHARHARPHTLLRRRRFRWGFLPRRLGRGLLLLPGLFGRLLPGLAFHGLHQPLYSSRLEERLGRLRLWVLLVYLTLQADQAGDLVFLVLFVMHPRPDTRFSGL